MVQKIKGSRQIQGGTVGAAELESTAVTPGSYGDATNSPQITVDADGRVTSAANVAITGVPAAGHNILSATHSDTLADTVVAGDLLIGNNTPKWARLAKSTNGFILRLVAGLPAWSDVKDALGMTTLGDIIYGAASGAVTRLAGNITTTRKFLRQVGDGVNSAAPAWDTLVAGDIPSSLNALTLTQNLVLSGIISPAQITADQNNYNPTGFATASTLILTSDAQWNVTGLLAGSQGELKLLVNTGANGIALVNDSASSSAANRFAFDGNFTILSNQGILLQYLDSRWRTYTPNLNAIASSILFDVNGSLIGDADELDVVGTDGISASGSQASPADPVIITLRTLLDIIALTAQTADITATAFGAGGDNGQYRITYYLVCTTADGTAGDVTLTIAHNDGTAARTQSSSAVSLVATNFTSGQFVVRVGNSTAPTYAITHTGIFATAQYALYLSIDKAG